MDPTILEGCISAGPWGTPGEHTWSYKAEGQGAITQIVIAYGDVIDSIRFKCDNGTGLAENSKRFGGSGGQTGKVEINTPEEYLTTISGTLDFYNKIPVVSSLYFKTNIRNWGPYGRKKGTDFSLPMEGAVIVGFHGSYGPYLGSIGVYVKPKCSNASPVARPSQYVSIGPCGGTGANNWIYKPKGTIKQIVIKHGVIIDSIKFKHDNGKGLVEDSEKFGGNGGDRTNKIDINGPLEYLTCISGTIGQYGTSTLLVTSLRFDTNLKMYGHFGSESDAGFSLPMKDGDIAGFHGHADVYLNSIGVFVKPKCSMHDVMKEVLPKGPGSWGGSGGREWDDGVFSTIKQIRVHLGRAMNMIHGVQFEYEDKYGKFVWSPIHGGLGGDIIIEVNLDDTSEIIVGITGFYGPIEGNSCFDAIRCISFNTNKGKYGSFGNEIGTYFTSTTFAGKVVGFHGRSGAYLSAIGVHMEYF